MGEIAKCPVCGKDPEVWCRDDEIRIRIVCCKHAAYSTIGWAKYAAAMALAKAAVQREITDMMDAQSALSGASVYEDRLQRVQEVFGEAKG